MKKFFRFLLLVLLLAGAAVAGYFFIETSGEDRNPFEFIPPDYIYLVESDRPTGDWQDLSKTDVWQFLKGNEFFADITESADYLDSLLQNNQRLVDLIKLGDLVISAHMINREDYDFIIAVDLRGKGRKFAKLKPVTIEVLEGIGYEVSTEKYFNIDLYDLYDPEYDDVLTMGAVDNVLIVSYTKSLVKKAITQSESPSITLDPAFAKVQDQADRGALYNLYVNYAEIESYIGTGTSDEPSMLADLEDMLHFSAFDLDMTDDFVELDGYTLHNDSFPGYLSVFQDVGRGEVRAGNVLPTSTAMYSSIGFDDFDDFYNRFSEHYRISDPEGYEDLQKNQNRIEKLLKIDIERDFFSWMSDEIVTAIVPVNGKYSYYALLHFDDYDVTKERLDHVTQRIGKTVVKFEEQDYRGFPIKYLELKGFFKIFFKKMFSEIEKPHYTYLDDYVIFSNDTTSLQHIIDEYLESRTLARDAEYRAFQDNFEGSSNLFTYIRTENFYNYLGSMLDYQTRKDLGRNRAYLLSFPQIGLQLYPGKGMYRTYMYGEFAKPEEALP